MAEVKSIAEKTLNTDTEEEDKFMQPNEIAFIIDKEEINDLKNVRIIGQNAYKVLHNLKTDEEGDSTRHYIFKMENNFDCSKIGSFEINEIQNNNKIFINRITDDIKFNHVLFQFEAGADGKKIKFEKNKDSPINCNTKVIIENGEYRTDSDNSQIITDTQTTITAENGELKFTPELQTEGGKPRRKRNKASMKKYKKRKSSTGKKKKIPRRRSRKLRRMK